MSRVYRFIENIFLRAEKEGRRQLLEPEVYSLFKAVGLPVPRFIFVAKDNMPSPDVLRRLRTSEIVVKVVSPLILHKTDVGGVRFVSNNAKELRNAIASMMDEVPRRWLRWASLNPELLKATKGLNKRMVKDSIRGFLLVEKVALAPMGFGGELLFGLRHTRDFGPVVTVGLGGVDVEYVSSRLKEEVALGHFSCFLEDKRLIASELVQLAFYEKLAKGPRGGQPVVSAAKIKLWVEKLALLGRLFSLSGPDSCFILEEIEANPVVAFQGELIPLDGLARFSRAQPPRLRPAVEAIRHLLRPRSIAVIGVSEKMNLGHIILNNILQAGFPKEKVYIVKPGAALVEGCRCFPEIASLPETVDLLVYALPAEQAYDCLQEIIRNEKARSMIIIAGGLGEKKGTGSEEKRIRDLLEKGRREGKLVPVVNGANCLGIISRPGKYDTTFIPEYKFPRPWSGQPGLVFISQSGAFMITRLNKSSLIAPEIAISVGNQLDLTVADYLDYFARESSGEVKVIALYLEGLREGDGLILARASSALIRKGVRIIIFKAGRTPAGKAATASHTASIAGDYPVFKSIMSQTGVYVAESLVEFETGIKALFSLAVAGKKPVGRRVGLLSNAGFECVIMADNILPGADLKLAKWSAATKARLHEILAPLRIDQLQDIRNPLDLTPVADDTAFISCVEAVIADPAVDCAVISPVPMTPALKTLPASSRSGEDFRDSSSLASRLIAVFHQTPKPLVFNIDAGPLYDPLADYLESSGLPVFRRVDEALAFLRKFIRLHEKIKVRD
ncbi:MAG: acetate--CoA ligase family protein [Candidatus Aminicenantales bacterium]